ncbi:pseudouridine synthase [Pontibacter sp. 172403-2]|uniref:pseudouridine synthase n=1 Tax=Pontibacter rufus TaxID=2791028 RepID=UPI0018AFCD02|nr:pseudouridine synthase [Pontibacter sp. 172403-2]MBF9253130.1 pseudouridine synthase [Pontibacter sp. 172403-2]
MARDNERPARGNAGEGRRGADRNNSGRPNNDRDGKKIFNRRDKPERSEGGERRSFNPDRRDNDRREGSERRSFGGDRREGSAGKPFGADRRNDRDGDRRTFSSDRPRRDDGDRKPFGASRNEGTNRRQSGDRKEQSERRENSGIKSFSLKRRDDRTGGDNREGGERRSYGDKREDRNNYSGKREGGERRPYGDRREGGDRKENSDRRSFSPDRREGGERRSFDADSRNSSRAGEGRPYKGRDSRPAYGEKRSFGDKKPYRAEGSGRPEGNDRSRGRADERDSAPATPDYNLNRYKNNTRIKKSNIKEEDDGTIRLNRYIANAGICSRREADLLIEAGEIKVNGQVVTEMGFKVQPADTIQYGKKILNREKLVYVMLNKPKDFLTTTDDPEGRKTVMSLVASASSERIFPVGRLDRNTTGLLLFTNDGELAQKLTHPSNNVKKIYQVELDKPITREDFLKVAEGVELEDGKADVDDVALLGDTGKFVGLEIHIGRNRIVRRIFEHLGYDVVSLDRVQYAGLTKKDLPRSNWRYLTEKEVVRLKFFM